MYKIEIRNEWDEVTDVYEDFDSIDEAKNTVISLINEGQTIPAHIKLYKQINFKFDFNVSFDD